MPLQEAKPLASGLTSQVLLRIVCVLVLCGVLVAGLWPFHAPKNEVSWLRSGNGLLFGDHGSIVSADAFRANESKGEAPCSLEIWLQPVQVSYSGTILAFYSPGSRVIPFALRQSSGGLALERTTGDQLHRAKKAKMYVGDVFGQQKPVLFTISSDESGTTIYADAALVTKSPEVKFSRRDLTGQVIIGNAPEATHNWSGQLKGFAIYDHELAADELVRHSTNWKNKPAEITEYGGVVALYLFNEGKGSVVHNQVDSTTDLLIPERFFLLHEQFLKRPWDEFYPGRHYWENVGINIAGFTPLGFFFSAYFSASGKIRATWLTIAVGFAVSITVEVLQAFLPTRDSGMTDVITNTLGTALGATLWTWAARHISLRAGIPIDSSISEERKDPRPVQ